MSWKAGLTAIKLAGPNTKMITVALRLNSFLLIKAKLRFGYDNLYLSSIFIYKDFSFKNYLINQEFKVTSWKVHN